MKLYKPLFSIIVILVQLVLSFKEYYTIEEWRRANPELDSIITLLRTYETLFLFVFIIGFFEMLSKPGWFKTALRIFLVCIVLGAEFSGYVPIDAFYSGVYNTAWFSAVVAIFLLIIRFGRHLLSQITTGRRNSPDQPKKTMKAITRTKYGPPNVLQNSDIPRPIPASDEVLIRVHCTTVNRTDCAVLKGEPFVMRFFTGLLKPSSRVPGTDFAGEIVECGKNVSRFKVGDRVWGLNDQGLASQAEYMTISENKAIAHIPEGIEFCEAVACAEGAHYAYNIINKVDINPGDRVLVNGATGAIGSAVLQMVKSLDAHVTAVGNGKNMELLKSLGSDKKYDYEQEDFTEVDTDKYHFVFDAVGKSTFGKCKKLLLPKGVYISSELGPGAENLYLPFITKLQGGKRVIFPIPSNCKRSILYVKDLLEKGRFKPVIDRHYTPEEIKGAYDYVQSGQKTGSVIVNFSSASSPT